MPKLQPKEIRQNGHVGIQRMAWKVPYILGCIEYHKSFKRFTDDIRNIVYLWNIYEVLTVQRRTGNPRPTKSRSRVKCSGFNFARGSESPFVHCTQPYRRAGNPPSSLHSDFVVVCQPLWCTTLSLAASLVSGKKPLGNESCEAGELSCVLWCRIRQGR